MAGEAVGGGTNTKGLMIFRAIISSGV